MGNFAINVPLLQAAAGEGGGLGGSLFTLVPLLLVVVIFYFFIIRPQNKKQKETQSMLQNIKKNDKVVTIGGIRGTVHNVKEETVVIKVDENTKMEFSKNAISTVLNKQEEKDSASKDSAK